MLINMRVRTFSYSLLEVYHSDLCVFNKVIVYLLVSC